MIQLQARPYWTKFHRPFTTSHGTREGTDIAILKLVWDGTVGYGEASLPPYRKAMIGELVQALRSAEIPDPANGIDHLLDSLQEQLEGSTEALAAFDMAIHDLYAKRAQLSVKELCGIPDGTNGPTMYTVATNRLEELPERIAEAPSTDMLKVKLTGENDVEKLDIIIDATNKPLFLDANQGWSSIDSYRLLEETLDKTEVLGLEQPFGSHELDLHAQLKAITEIPLYADESFETMDDLIWVSQAFSGINIKLMKCGGLRNALRIIVKAKNMGLRIMLGSMSETSCGTAAAMQMASLADLLDQDGPLLLRNDPFEQSNEHGLGVKLREDVVQDLDIR